MDRRQVLRMGAALTTMPIAGCAASALPSQPAPTPAPGAPAIAVEQAAVARPDPAAVAGTSAPEDKSAAASPAPGEGPRSSFSRVVGRLGRNHGHALTVSLADVTAGAEKTYALTAASGHAHTVTLGADDMKGLLAGKVVRTKSTTDRGHAHRVVARCAPPVDPPAWVSVCQFSSSGQDQHEMVITAADLAAKTEKTYDVQGLAGHAHEVTLSAADFEKLLKGGPVTSHTTRDPDDAHLHTVSIEYHPDRAKGS